MKTEDYVVCRCEEVNRAEILAAIENGANDADAVKRMTRAGMGLCQGKTCGYLVARLVARSTGQPVAEIRGVTTRMPVRPVPARVLAATRLPAPP